MGKGWPATGVLAAPVRGWSGPDLPQLFVSSSFQGPRQCGVFREGAPPTFVKRGYFCTEWAGGGVGPPSSPGTLMCPVGSGQAVVLIQRGSGTLQGSQQAVPGATGLSCGRCAGSVGPAAWGLSMGGRGSGPRRAPGRGPTPRPRRCDSTVGVEGLIFFQLPHTGLWFCGNSRASGSDISLTASEPGSGGSLAAFPQGRLPWGWEPVGGPAGTWGRGLPRQPQPQPAHHGSLQPGQHS